MRTALRPGGQLAFQVPSNFRHVSHLLARQVANESPRTVAASSSRRRSTPTCSTSWAPKSRSCGWRCTATSFPRHPTSSSG
jgi:trans-aconitate methyltransferase